MFWYDRENPNVDFMDIREESHILCDGRTLEIKPDFLGDFRDIPCKNESYHMVVFDPPHLKSVGDKSWLKLKYGKLSPDWEEDIRKGFLEAFRVLKPNGVLIFKWNEEQIPAAEVIALSPHKPIVGDRRGKTRWVVFMKPCQ